MNRNARAQNPRPSHHAPINPDHLLKLRLATTYLDDNISQLNSKEPKFIHTLSTVPSVPNLQNQNHSAHYDTSAYSITTGTKGPINGSKTLRQPQNHSYLGVPTTIVPTPNYLKREGTHALNLETDEHTVRPSCESIAGKKLPIRSPNKRTLSDVHFSFVNSLISCRQNLSILIFSDLGLVVLSLNFIRESYFAEIVFETDNDSLGIKGLNNNIDATPSIHPDQPLPKPRISMYTRHTPEKKTDTARHSLYSFDIMNRTPKSTPWLTDIFDKKKDTFLTMEILRMTMRFLNLKDILSLRNLYSAYRNQKKYKKLFEKKIAQLIIQGVTPQEQYAYWNSYINFRHLKIHHPFSFTSKFVKDCSYIKDICSDLDRTLPDYKKFDTKEGKGSLLRVLVALSNTVKDVGYIQGLNSIVGVALTCLKEEEAFWMLLYMMEKLNVKEILNESFTRINILNYQLQTFLDNYLPELSSYLEANGMVWKHITVSWFITLFAQYLSFHNVIKFWNMFFIKGNAFLIQFTLAVLSYYKEIILNTEIDNFGQFLNDKLSQISDYHSFIFHKALDFKVTKRLMQDLESHYKNGEPKLQLIRDHRNKLQWKVIIESKVNTQNTIPQSLQSLNELDLSSSDQENSGGGSFNSLSSHRNSVPLIRSLFDAVTKELPETVKQMFTPKQRKRPILKSSVSSRNLKTSGNNNDGIKSLQELGKYKKMHSTPENYEWEHGRCVTEPDGGFSRHLEMSRILEEEEEIKKENMRKALRFLEGRIETEGCDTYYERNSYIRRKKNDIFKEASNTTINNNSMLLHSFNGTPLSTLSSAQQQRYTIDVSAQSSRRKSALVNHSDINTLFEQSQSDYYKLPVYKDSRSHLEPRRSGPRTLTNLSPYGSTSQNYDYRYHNKML